MGSIAKLRSSAENAREFLRERAKLEAAGLYNPTLAKYEGFDPNTYSTLDRLDTEGNIVRGRGVWDKMSPTPYQNMADFTKAYFDNIFGMIQDMIKKIIGRLFKRFPKALTQIEELVLKFVEDEFNKTRNLQTDIAEMNFTYFYIDELSNDYQKLIQLSLLKDENNQNNTNNINQNQKNEMPFKKTSEISFFKSAKDQNSYYKSLAEYVKSLDDYIYFQIIRNLREYIPKATGYFL